MLCTRRDFLTRSAQGIGLLAFSRFAPSFLVNSALADAPAPEKDRTVLVIIQLAGGNDGLNTLVPYEDPNYHRLRPTLGLRPEQVLRLSDALGLHPSCAPLRPLFQAGKLSLVQNVGYPNPNRSHFRSTEIWETGSGSSQYLPTGWVGRYLDATCGPSSAKATAGGGAPVDAACSRVRNLKTRLQAASTTAKADVVADHDPAAIHLDTPNGEPPSLVGVRAHPTFGLIGGGGGRGGSEESRRLLERDVAGAGAGSEVNFLRQTMMDALVTEVKVQRILGQYRPAGTYPAHPFSAALRNVAGLIAGGMPTRVYFVTLSGFDTHVNQAATQARLLGVLSEGLAAFQSDLEGHKLDGQVVTMTFSEFGRRPNENESHGTDHGTAAPLFMLGSRLRGGVYGTAPRLDNLAPNQDLAFSTDFRSVYATVLDQWLGCPSASVLGPGFPDLPLFV